jgi:2-iminobutanoate/2-iminopropanoate deaminase
MSDIKSITLEGAAPSVAHYSAAIVANGTIYVSGQVPRDPFTGEKHYGTAAEQTEVCLRNIERILLAAGSNLTHVVKTTAYVSDIALWGEVNAVYQRIFGDHRPARAIIPVGDYGEGMVIEIDAIAVVG